MMTDQREITAVKSGKGNKRGWASTSKHDGKIKKKKSSGMV